MAIETLEDWNNRMPCCCAIPGCPEPVLVCQSLYGRVRVQAYVPPGSGVVTTFYRKKTTTYPGGGVLTFTYEEPYYIDLGDAWVIPPGTPVETNNGLPQTGTPVDTYDLPITATALWANAKAALDAALDWDDPSYTKEEFCAASYNPQPYYIGSGNRVLEVVYCRYKWRVPDIHTGTYFKLTWDVLERSVGELGEAVGSQVDDPQVDPSFVSEDLTWEWIRPEGELAPEDWESAWYELPVPTAEAQRDVVNIRYSCRRPETSRYGVKPQTMGLGYELPVPP